MLFLIASCPEACDLNMSGVTLADKGRAAEIMQQACCTVGSIFL